ncbi:hypothetical protein H0H92_009920 [Tricholoma furcatifolium]|nr:hypothetical protein H0H92_009920 [Tricholoma furcatifolium]
MLDHVLPQQLLIPKFISPKPIHPTSISPILPDSPATVEDDLSSHSPNSGSATFHYPDRSTSSFDSPISPAEIYDNSTSYSVPSQSFSSGASTPNFEFIDSDGTVRASNYLSDSPSPSDIPPSSSYTHAISATHSQPRRPSQISASYFPHDRYDTSPDIDSDRHSRNLSSDKYSTANTSHFQVPSLDQRRMSEPAILPSPHSYSTSDPHRIPYSTSSLTIPRSSSYAHTLQRGASVGSLRDLRLAHLDYQSHPQLPYSSWKGHRSDVYHEDDGFDGSISPLQPDFTFGPRGPYSPSAENFYGPSPPGTGTSSSSLGPLSPLTDPFGHDMSRDPNSKTYSFVALPGNAVKKRPRRRYDEIERLYQCSFPECNKAYGTLNHLNAHVTMQKHGPKRQPSGSFGHSSEFKELRKQWRKAKKSTSPGPSRPSNMGLRHDTHEYRVRRHDPNTPLYTRQPPLPPGLTSPVSSAFPDLSGRMAIEASRYQVDPRGSHGRQRYASWQGSSRTGPPQYLSSSLPSQSHFPPDSDSHLPNDPRAPQRSRSHSSLDLPIGRLPPDSTLLTPLPGYQPSLLPTLQEGENPFPAGTEYELFDDGHDGRSQAGHGSHGDSEEKF